MTTTALVPYAQQLPAATGDLDAYIRAVSGVPMLDADEEQDLARKLQQRNDLEAARKLVLAHLRFVVHIARGYHGYGLPLGDLIQEGNVGLMKAVKRFDPEHGVRLVSFAVHWIRAEIHEYILRNWRIVKVATTKAQRKLFFNLRSAKQRLGWFTHEEVETVARELGVTPGDVLEMESRLSGNDLTYDPTPDDDDADGPVAPAAYLSNPADDPLAQLEAEDWEARTGHRLGAALEGLDARARDILRRRWLDEDHKPTLHELAAEYGVSAERIRQIEAGALKKLKTALVA